MADTDCPGCLRLQREVDALRAQVEQLTRLLEQLQRTGKRQAAPFSKGPPSAAPKTPGRKPGKKYGTKGRRPPPDPEQITETYDAPLPEACPDCGGSVQETHVAPQYQVEIPRRPIHRQFNVHVGCCRACRRRLQGRHPLQTSDALGAAASQVGPDAQAAVVVLNKRAGLSHAKISACFADLFGIPLTRGASAQIVLRAADRLGPAYQEIVQATRDAAVLSADETGWRIGGQSAWLHVWVGGRATCYAIDPHRSADALERVIGIDWDGVLQHDGFASYDRFTAATHQQCLAHVLRRARELLATATRGAVHYPRRLITLFQEAIQLRRGRLSARARAEARDDFELRLLRLIVPERVVPAYETLSAHLGKHLLEWFTFLSWPTVEATNWQAEQAIRPAVVNRKVWGGNRTDRGAKAQGVLMSVLQTCRQQARVALDFVSQTLRAFTHPQLAQPILLATR